MGITTDNASNNLAFINLLVEWGKTQGISLNITDNHFRCFAHIINLCVQKALKVLDDKLKQVSLFLNKKFFNFIFN
jgi:hypothetical protein